MQDNTICNSNFKDEESRLTGIKILDQVQTNHKRSTGMGTQVDLKTAQRTY